MTVSSHLKVAVIGIGKIARDQHIPAILQRGDIALSATVSRNSSIDGVPSFRSLSEALRSKPEIEALIICTPPQTHYGFAREGIATGRHILLEKPPTSSPSEIRKLEKMATEKGVTLFTSWHSRCAPGVEPARLWLSDKKLVSVQISWKEDVRKWHPGQNWLFEPGGMGVFDPGINALSIATKILPAAFTLEQATLEIPTNRQAPIAAGLRYIDESGVPISADFDFRQTGDEIWEIVIETEEGMLVLSEGGSRLSIDQQNRTVGPAAEYARLYDRFSSLVRDRKSDVDFRPLVLVSDALRLGKRVSTAEFVW